MISIYYIVYFYYDLFFINVVSYIGYIYLIEYDDVLNFKFCFWGFVNVIICWLLLNVLLFFCNIFVGLGFVCGILLFIFCIYYDLNFKLLL